MTKRTSILTSVISTIQQGLSQLEDYAEDQTERPHDRSQERRKRIYFLLDPDEELGMISYVGQTVNVPQRFKDHMRDAFSVYLTNSRTTVYEHNSKKDLWLRELILRGRAPMLRVDPGFYTKAEVDALEQSLVMQLALAGHPLTNTRYMPTQRNRG